MNNNIPNSNSAKMNELLGNLSGKLGVPASQLKAELAEGKFDSAIKNLKPEAAMQFNMILNNPNLAEQIMSAPQAQAIYRKLNGDK